MSNRTDGGNAATITEEGMSLRDYFAAKALAAMASEHHGAAWNPQGTAEAAYEFADAMLKARAEK